MTAPAVTVLCATLNARAAVRLTLASFRRYTPEPCRVWVADNGSTDGTLDDLLEMSWLSVIPLTVRRALAPAAAGAPDAEITSHGATLDWLAVRVRTPFFLTLDSDVEFLEAGWLTDMLDLMAGEDLDALGVYEPGFRGYRPRLAPYVLLLRTATFHAVRASFLPFVRIEDAEEARRWQARPRGFQVQFEEIAAYRTAAFYPTAAYLFERLCEGGARWRDLPAALAAKFQHLGHMSWAPGTPDVGGAPRGGDLAGGQAAKLAYVQERLRRYGYGG